MEDKLDIAYVLIDKAFTGQASASELSSINAWKMASGENETIYDETIQLLELVRGITGWRKYDDKQAWSVLEKKIEGVSLIIKWKKIMAIAAIFLLVLTATYWKIGSSNQLYSNHELVGAEHKFSVLDDGSELILGANAIVDLDNFSERNRQLTTTGDYFVHVKSNPEVPFNIHTRNITIQVLGTSFKVEEKDEKSIVRVRKGSVRISSKDGASFIVEGGEEFLFLNGSVSVSKLKINDWGLFKRSYVDEPVANLLADLQADFPYLKFDSSKISKDCKITTKINQSTILEILQELALIFDVSYNIEAGEIVINKISC